MEKLLTITLIVVILSCGIIVWQKRRELPEGYKLYCSIKGDKYTLGMPGGRLHACTWDSKWKVISFAHYLEKTKNKPLEPELWSNNYEWEECE